MYLCSVKLKDSIMTDAELQQINAKFNEQLQLQIEGKFPKPQYNSVDVRKQLISAAKIIESFESSKDSCTFLLINLVFGRDDKRSSPCHFEHPLALSSRSNHPLSFRASPCPVIPKQPPSVISSIPLFCHFD